MASPSKSFYAAEFGLFISSELQEFTLRKVAISLQHLLVKEVLN